jgi:regulator of replication initiation timing
MTEQTIKFRDPVVQCVVNKFVDRSDVGFAKYKTTMRDDQSDVFVWLNHLQEELMDATLYLQRLKEEISTLREEKALLNATNDIDVIDAFVFETDKKKQSKDSSVTKKKRKNGHGRNWTIDEDIEVQHERFKHFASNKDPFEGFHTTFSK